MTGSQKATPAAGAAGPWDELRRHAPGVEILTDPLSLQLYEVDAGVDRGRPDAVAFPTSAPEVASLLGWAAARRIPIVARGSGTGLSGGAVAPQGGLMIVFSKMKRVLSLEPDQRMAVVEPGVVNTVLNDQARPAGLVFPPDPSSGLAATLGGNVAENAGGPHCVKYGVTTNYVAGLQVLLADGQVMRLGGPAADYPEYDFLGIMTGNEGTLGLITEARLRLLRLTTEFKTLLAAFASTQAACDAVSAIIAAGLIPAALELIDHKMAGIIEAYAHAGLPVDAAACLVVEVDGHAASLAAQMDEIVKLLEAHGAYDLVVAQDAAQRAQIWKARKSVGGAVARLAPAYISLDATVPRSRLARALAEMDRICEARGVRVGYVGHAGDGNFHPHLLIDDPEDAALIHHIVETGYHMMAACVTLDGSISGEHGIGVEKRTYLPLMFGPAEMAAMLDLKAVCDPEGLLNPGKIFPEGELGEGGAVWIDGTHGSDTEDTEHVGGAARRESTTLPTTYPSVSSPRHPSETGVEDGRDPFRGFRDPNAPPRDRDRLPFYTPTTVEQAAEALGAWSAEAPPGGVRIRGGGTKSGLLPAAGVTLSTRGLSGITSYAADDLYVRVGAGTPLAALQTELARDGVWAPLVSPWPSATVGGIVAANFNAPLRMRYGYGSIRDQVLEATIILPGGQAVRAGRPIVKNVAGYDLAKLFIGSHGTLGLLANITLRLAPLPRARATVACAVPDMASARPWAARLLRQSLVATSLLLCRGGCLLPEAGSLPGIDPASLVLVYTAEGWPGDVAAELAEVRATLPSEPWPLWEGAGAVPPGGSDFWAGWLAETGSGEVLLRIGLPPRDIFAYLGSQALDERAAWLADLASGLVYLRGPAQGLDIPALQAAAAELGGYACVLAAPWSAAIADRWGYRPQALPLMARLKARWDPQGYLNPGVFLV